MIFTISGDQVGKLTKQMLARDSFDLISKRTLVWYKTLLKLNFGSGWLVTIKNIRERRATGLLYPYGLHYSSIATIQEYQINDSDFVLIKGILLKESTFKK